MAGSGGARTLVADSYSSVAPVLAEPLPVDDPPLAANGDSLSAPAADKETGGPDTGIFEYPGGHPHRGT